MNETPLHFIEANPEDVAHTIGLLAMVHPIDPALQAEFFKNTKALHLEKGQHLVQQGQLCHHMFFIRKGAVAAYSLHKQKKITTYISVENEFVSSLSGLYGQEPSKEAIVAVEPTHVLALHTDLLQDLYKRFFDLNYVIRQVYENYYREAQERSHVVRIGNAEERYLYFTKSKPGYIDRIPLDIIASFLDMKPETLSRIKKQNNVPMQAQEAEDILEKLEQFMLETECFREKTLKVQDLATRLGIPTYKLSMVLNMYHKKSFKDFLNHYRIAYLKTQLEKEGALQSFTIEALARQAGFASRSGFYKAFKKMEGINPKEYLASVKDSM